MLGRKNQSGVVCGAIRRIARIACFLFLLFGLAAFQTASAQASFTSLAVSPTSGTVAPGALLTVSVTGSTRSTVANDTVQTVELREGASVLKTANYPVNYDPVTDTVTNATRTINLSAALGAGTHQLYVRAYTYNGMQTDSQILTVTVTQSSPVNAATYVSQNVPTTMETGKTYSVSVTMKNTGTTTWSPSGTNAYRLGSQNPGDNYTWGTGFNRVNLATTVAPNGTYTFTFNVTAPATAGTYNFQWQMVQEYIEWFGGQTPNIAVQVKYPQPTATFSSPSDGATYTTSGTTSTVSFTGSAAPGSGATLSSVQLLENGVAFASGTSSSISGSKALSIGSHTIELRVTDSRNQVVSAYRTVTVNASPPTAAFTSPSEGATYTASGTTATVSFSGSAAAGGGGATLSSVQLLENGVAFASGTSSTINGSKALSLGTHTIELRVTDSRSQVTSAYRTVKVITPPPTASFTSPSNGASFTATTATTNVSVSATGTPATGGSISQLKLYVDNVLNITVSTSTLSTTVSLAPGSHTLGVEAVDGSGITGPRTNISVSVIAPTPTASLTTPANYSYFVATGTTAPVTVQGTATAVGGSAITKIELLDGSTVIDTKTAVTSYSGTLNLAVGLHSLSLRATNAAGGVGTSPAVALQVVAGKSGDSAYFLGQTVPTTMRAGQPYTVTLQMLNNGTTTWTDAANYRLGAQNPQDNLNFGGRAFLASSVAQGQTATITFQVTAPSAPGTYNFQWQMLLEHVAWFGDLSTNVPITVTTGPGPTATLAASPTNVRVSGTATQTVNFTGSGARSGGSVTKLELFKNSGKGYGTTPVSTVTGSASTLSYSNSLALSADVYTFKLRATDSAGVQTDSTPVVINITNSSLLGTVSGVRTNTAGNPELFGWVCQPGNAAGLTYQVLMDAPTQDSGGTLLTTGTANINTEPDTASVQTQCGTPNTGHHFVVDLSTYVSTKAGRALYVYATTADGANTVTLPCADNNCTMPGSMRVGLTKPLNGDRYQLPLPAFLRMQLTNATGTFDEIGFVVDGRWVAATNDGTPGAYSASVYDLTPRSAPYTVYAKVRQGNTTIQSVANQFYMVAADPTTISIASPADGATVALAVQTLNATVSGPATSVKFFVNGTQLSGTASGSGTSWTQSWTPSTSGSYSIYARAYDVNGAQVAQSGAVAITVAPAGSSATPEPINIDVPQLANGLAGTLPGNLGVSSSGAASYSIPIAVPPGSAGMRPTLSLDYSSDNTTGSAGLGWSIGGLSNIDRCGKIAAIDNVTSRVKFTNEDRLCLDGQRLVLENGSNDDVSYWADGAVYRTEIESFTRVTALGVGVANRAFKAETKDGLWRWYGWDASAASVVKDLRTDSTATGLTHRWRLDRSQDRVGNFIAYAYQNFANGENKPLTISWGGNGTAAYAKVSFGYQSRTDSRRAYVGGSPMYEAQILKTITTTTASDSGAAIQALTYTLAHKMSPTSGRSLLSQIQVCGADGACLPATTFQSGEPDPAATKSFVQLGADRDGPNLESLGVPFTSDKKYSPMEMIFVGDFNGDGRADILERRGDKRLFLSDTTGTGWTEKRPLPFASSSIEVMEIGDFNGDGKTDLLIADTSTAPATYWQVCLYESGTYNCRPVDLKADGINANDRIHSRLVRDFDSDGRDDIFISSGPYLGVGAIPPRYVCTGYDIATGFNCQPTAQDVLNEDAYGDTYTSAGHDTADFDGDGHVDTAELTRCKWMRNPDTGRYAWDCGNYTAVNVFGYSSVNGAPFVGGWYPLSPTSPEGVIPQVRGGTLSADFSADGLTDIVFGTSSLNPVTESLGSTRASNFCTSRGDGKADCTVLPSLGTGLDHLILTVQDFDGDGVPDLLRPGVDTWGVDSFTTYVLCRIGNNGNFQNCEPWSGPTFYSLNRKSALRDGSVENSWTSPHSQFLGDFDGDGRVDIVTYLTGGKWQIFRAAPQAKAGQYLDKIVSVTNGRGNVESVQFASPADATVYVGDGTAIDGRPLATGWPIKRVPNTRPLVSRLERSNGASGSRVTTYEYSGYAVDAQGRGNSGFARIKEHDSISNVDTSTWYSQQFPSVGLMTDRLVVHGVDELERTQVTLKTFDHFAKPDSVANIIPYVKASVTTKRDLDGTAMGVTTSSYGYDEWVNASSVTEETILGATDYVSVTSTMFNNDPSRWLLAKPVLVSVTKTTAQGAITRTTTYGYDPEKGLLTSETREPGNQDLQVKTTYDRAASGTPSNPFGLVNKTTIDWYDAASKTPKTRVVSQTDYDAYGRYPRKVTNALGQSESASFDPRSGAKTSVTAINGLTTSFTVDSLGRTIGETHPDNIEVSTVERQCDSSCVAGATTLVIKRTLSGSSLTSAPILSHVDSAGHVLRTQTWGFSGAKILSDVEYDIGGREWKAYHPRFEGSAQQLAKQTGYDDLGRPISVEKPDEFGQTYVWTTKYSGLTTTFSQPAPKGVSVSSLTRIETRDVWARLVSANDTKGNSTTYVHDAFGNLTKVTDAKKNVVTVTFDPLGRRTDLRDPDLGWIQYNVDALGQVYRQISPNQRIGYTAGTLPPDDKVTMFTYDDLGRMTQRREPDLVSNWIFDNGTSCAPATSQSCGQLIEANTMAGSTKDYVRTHTYDSTGRPKTTTTTLDVAYTSTTEYDTWGRLLRQRHQRAGGVEKVFDYRYNSTGYLARIERGGLVLWRATAQDAANRLENAELGNNTKVARSYSDYAGQVLSSTLTNGTGAQLLNEIYQYDALSNVAQRDVYWDTAPDHFSEVFDYDELNRLRLSTLGGTESTFTYDEIGNILNKTGVGVYTYPTSGPSSVRPHAVSSIPGSSFDYDDNGNLKSGAGRTVTWTSFDMPRKITKGAESSTFWYGPEHQRVRQARNTDTCGSTSCVYYAGAMEVEIAGAAATVKTYWPNGLGVEIDDVNGTRLRWTHLDRQGSVVAISDEAGTVRERLIYDSWGKRRDLAGAGTPDSIDGVTDNKGYTGHEMLDKLDLVHMNGRVYDPLIARFMSADPIIQEPEFGQSYNRYAYVWNNPTNLTDPTGFAALTQGSRTVIYDDSTVESCAKGSNCFQDADGGLHVITQVIDTDSRGRTTSYDMTGGSGRNSNSSADLKHRADQLKNVIAHIQGQINRRQRAMYSRQVGFDPEYEDKLSGQLFKANTSYAQTIRAWRWTTPFADWTPADHEAALSDAIMGVAGRGAGVKLAVPGTNAQGMLTSRGKFWKRTLSNMWEDAEPGPTGGRLCPSCKVEVNVPPNTGVPRDWDGSHNPSWSNRFFSPTTTRQEVLENYNKGARLECPSCNRRGGANDSRFESLRK